MISHCRRVLVRLMCGLIAVGSVLTGCTNHATPSEPPKPPARWPDLMSESRFVWTAEPGIDLLSRPAVVVRAYRESVILAGYGGSNDFLYPGFDRAVAPNGAADSPRPTRSLWPELKFPIDRPVVGTSSDHLLRVDQTARNVTVVVCHWSWTGAGQQENGQYQSGPTDPAAPGVFVFRLNLLAPANPNADKLAPQKGASPFALTDVFGDWKVVGSLSPLGPNDAGSDWPDFLQDRTACNDRAPESVERRLFLTSGEHPRSDFPTLPADPGWPAENQ